MKALLMVLALVTSISAKAYDAQFVPTILIQSVEVGTSITFPGGPDNNEVIVTFVAAACRTLDASEFTGEVLNGTIFVYQANMVDCFGPTRRQTVTTKFFTNEGINQSFFIGNPVLLRNQFHF